jgi:hypothetical protein
LGGSCRVSVLLMLCLRVELQYVKTVPFKSMLAYTRPECDKKALGVGLRSVFESSDSGWYLL